MSWNWRHWGGVIWLAVCGAVMAPAVAAQDTTVVRSPVLTIDSEQLYSESLFGKRVQNEFEADVAVLEAENRRIEAELIEEEKQLTQKRADMKPEDFRVLADEFDAKVQRIRNEQSSKLRNLAQTSDAARRQFLQKISPILESIMTEAGAAVIVESRNVFLSAKIIDVTEDAVARVDQQIADGADLPLTQPD
ncbi:Outer membrane protein [Thalassovita gelatinovora]|uniref:Outer membrane protein n=1 Tax=Thalassovita gelatinovora TaxID=53501 RepID=A0A0P1FKE5_THAGE|nr:OmpH family outer membrane protein [Thalassovita gelatinovora]QIZ79029.1 OmpH family outer membrane protein [Thalassovita gelatinovora]CUH68605.1 Outer membrane protein [Thalassovita gelatinovora]SEQ55357.1 periplasmic chaperone for outer membrane proteins Skp [Thalassovita gelatinovora]